jgi:hypothetical protein
MKNYKNLHKWMFIPLVVMQLGILKDYWGDFTENSWSVHVHYWTGSIWYIYLIVQPYFATHGHLEKHRTNGIIGMFLAGGVCLTAFSMLNRDLLRVQMSMEMRDQFGPFEPWFFYGVAVLEIVMITSFGFAVVMSIIHRKDLENHAWWLISTVFIILEPAVARGLQYVFIGFQSEKWPDVDIMLPFYIGQATIILLIILIGNKYRKLKHPATFLAIGVNIFNCLLEPIGRSESIQIILEALIKP